MKLYSYKKLQSMFLADVVVLLDAKAHLSLFILKGEIG